MKISIKTELLKAAVVKASKGAGNNKLIPITSLIGIIVKNGKMTLITTDMTNFLYINVPTDVSGDDFYTTVDVNIFSKLVSKLNCDMVTLEINQDAVLHINANGDYRIELPLDENGQAIRYPDPLSKIDFDSMKKENLKKTTAQVIIETIKSALAKTLEEPCYTAYYMHKQVLATDTYKIAQMEVSMFDEPKLISPELFDLLSVMDEENITVYTWNDTIVYQTQNCIVVGKLTDGIENYAIDAINELIELEFPSFCSVSKQALIQLLDRLMLFVGPYDKNGINLTFTDTGLQVSSLAASGIEMIPYIVSDNFMDYTCTVDVYNLMQEVKAIQDDKVNIYYNNDSGLKFEDGNIIIIIALLDNE